MNLCLCGAQASYPHHPACPRPLFRASERDEDRWWIEYRANLARVSPAVVTP